VVAALWGFPKGNIPNGRVPKRGRFPKGEDPQKLSDSTRTETRSPLLPKECIKLSLISRTKAAFQFFCHKNRGRCCIQAKGQINQSILCIFVRSNHKWYGLCLLAAAASSASEQLGQSFEPFFFLELLFFPPAANSRQSDEAGSSSFPINAKRKIKTFR